MIGCAEIDDFAGGRLTIDLEALKTNYLALAERVRPARVAAVVKADAYGLGARKVVPALLSAGCVTFFVAHLKEALAIRRLLPEHAELYVLNGLQPGAEELCAASGVHPVLNSFEQALRWRHLALDYGRPLPAALQVDSGMGRLGLSPAEVPDIADPNGYFSGLEISLVMSHLACADTPGAGSNAAQLRAFSDMAAQFPGIPIALSNSAGCFAPAAFHGDIVRPGLALYGAAPISGMASPMKPVVSLDARVIQVRTVPAGHGIGYGLTAVSAAPRRIATLSVGYADGWPRSLGNRGAAFWSGKRLPIVGRVSMDSMAVDLTGLDISEPGPGDFVELIGASQSVDQVAADADTIPYEILTRLGERYDRRYHVHADCDRLESVR